MQQQIIDKLEDARMPFSFEDFCKKASSKQIEAFSDLLDNVLELRDDKNPFLVVKKPAIKRRILYNVGIIGQELLGTPFLQSLEIYTDIEFIHKRKHIGNQADVGGFWSRIYCIILYCYPGHRLQRRGADENVYAELT